jgi:DNA-binding response OmpR family regulator
MKKILIIDDDKELSLVVAEILTRHGYAPKCHSTEHNVLDVALDYEPSLILLDARLGEFDGTDICKELKRVLTTPIVIFTADSTKQKASTDCGADGFIEQPFDMYRFVKAVNSYL